MRSWPSLLLILLAGCARGPSLNERLSTFVGVGEADLVSALGVPVRVHEAEGRRFLQFEQRRSLTVAPPPSFYYAPYYGPWGPQFGYWPGPPSVVQLVCDVTFSLRQGRVEGFTTRGEGCG